MRFNSEDDKNRRLTTRLLALLSAGSALTCTPLAAAAPADQGACAYTAQVTYLACGKDTEDNYLINLGRCANIANATARSNCKRAAAVAKAAAPAGCTAQLEMRDDICDAIGPEPYDPPIDPAQFVDPRNIGGSIAPNPWFPLVPGSAWYFEGGGETNTVEVTGETAVIRGVTVAVVHDAVYVNGEPSEDTIDWFAQDISGNVWYFGESTHTFGENGLIDGVEGSWTAGEKLARQGLAFQAAPQVDDTYRQEFSLGDAEDIAHVLSLTASASVAGASCNGNCILTEEFTPIDPDVLENKYYAPGVGFILETDPATGERLLELISYHIGAH